MCHILGQGEIPGCIEELFESAETLHAKMKADPDNKTLAHAVHAFEAELQAFTTESLKAVERLQAKVDELNA